MRKAGLLVGLVVVSLVAAAAQEPVYRLGEGIVPPSIEKEVKPNYTPDALTARVEGSVKLECVVLPGGSVSLPRVVESLHPSLDAEALRALSQWRFKPGTKDGKRVAVRVEIAMTFSLREREGPRGPALGSREVCMRDGVQGSVKLECVVLPDGTVGDVRVTEPLHSDLDAEAVRTLRQWTFKPGTKDGVAVPVQVEVEMTFTLRSGPRKSPDER
jgi:TonB family protein